MHIFFCNQPGEQFFTLDQAESNHLAKVLRLREGETVNVINGDGKLYTCSIVVADSRRSSLEITASDDNFEKRNYHLHIAIAPTKSMERFEMFVEKTVELGIDEITPLLTSRSERKSIKKERVERIVISAMKQSLKAKMTKVNDLTTFESFIRDINTEKKYIAHCIQGIETRGLKEIYHPGQKATVLIGPEGDFSEAEVEKALASGFESVNLGKSRLRTETAGITACSHIYLINM